MGETIRTRRYPRLGPAAAVLAMVGALAFAGCGGGDARQDADEPEGTFPVEVVTSSFPVRQKLARTEQLKLGVRNTGERPIPNLAITVHTDEKAEGSFLVRDEQPDLSDPNRPVWILEQGFPKLAGQNAPSGAITAYANTFAFGELPPGESVEAVWRVTPVRGGTHTVEYKVAAGLTGKAKAVGEDGSDPAGRFVVTIDARPPRSRVDDDGDVVELPQR